MCLIWEKNLYSTSYLFFYRLLVVPRCALMLDCFLPHEKHRMFIRKKKNRGGSTSIMLVIGERKAGKQHSSLRVIKNFGASHNNNEVEKLISQAEEYRQHLLSVSPKAIPLKITTSRDIQSCTSMTIGFSDVYGKCFDAVFAELRLKSHELKKLRDLLVMRIANPTSKRKTAMIAHEYGMNCQVDSVYKLMDRLTDDVITHAKKIVYLNTTKRLAAERETVDVMFYDLTTIYFETNTQDTLRDFGFSKDGKPQHVQIMLVVIVSKHGLPIDYEEFPGNCYEGHTLLPVMDKIKQRYAIDRVVLVADAALMNKINLTALTQQNIHYVIAARIKNTTKAIQSIVLEQEGYQMISSHEGDFVQAKTITLPTGDTLIAYYSSQRARKDEYDRQKDIARIEKYLQSTTKSQLTSRLKKSYVVVSKSSKLSIDFDKLSHEKSFDGFFGIQTNLASINPNEILNTYRGLWQVEQTFRIAKSNLEIRPVFHYNTKRIKAHFLICYMSLALIRYVEFQLRKQAVDTTIEQLHLLLAQMRITKIQHADKNTYVLLEDPPPELIPIYQALRIKWHKKFSQEALL